MQTSHSRIVGEYCELDRTNDFFHQTINTYSNLGYFFLGMIVVLVSIYDRKNKNKTRTNALQQFHLISFLFGCCLIYLCIGSAFFHASLTWIGQRVDMNATYSICISLIGISCYRFFATKERFLTTKNQRFFILFLVVTIIVFIELHLLISSSILLPLLISIAIVFTILNYNKNKNGFNMQLAILSFLFMVGAFVLRTLDIKKIGCNPISIYQGHALWHVFTGMSAFLLYWFYRSEKV